MIRASVVLGFLAILAMVVAQDRKACFESFKSLKDGDCDDVKLASIKENCGDKFKDETCVSLKERHEKMKPCHDAFKAVKDNCDDTTLAKVKEICPKHEGKPEPTCDMIKNWKKD